MSGSDRKSTLTDVVKRAAWVATSLSILMLVACSGGIKPPDLPNYSASDLEAQTLVDNERALDALLDEFPDAQVPTVERVRLVTLEEWPEAMASCLTVEGFDAVAEDGGLGTSAPDGQELPYAIAYYICSIEYPIDPRVMVPLVDDQIRYLYEYYTQVATPCLQGEGYEVPEPPSLQTYVSTYGQPGSWETYKLVAEAVSSQEEWERINRLCPQIPVELYGR